MHQTFDNPEILFIPKSILHVHRGLTPASPDPKHASPQISLIIKTMSGNQNYNFAPHVSGSGAGRC